jgi:hypothetical protein
LEAQQAYTASLNEVAERHIGYVQNRIGFFLDLEQLQVNRLNYWPELQNEDYPFVPNTDYPRVSPRPYGVLPQQPWYSQRMRRMEQVPPGQAGIHRSAQDE